MDSVIQKAVQLAVLDMLLAKRKELRNIATAFSRSPQEEKSLVWVVVSCGGR